ncbi:hypothetical protein ATCC90586_001412 [Pythium insidiosum]|nr:hypothetical protein ATCC90586_001412 [Pythium insidiosum]
MGSTAELIWKHFGKRCDLYEVLGVSKTATDKEITKGYRKLALRYHPDKQRGDAAARADATEKFQAISAIHSILSNQDTRAVYDETGSIAPTDELPDDSSFEMWVDYFAKLFPKVTQEDIVKFENKYRFSEEERRDVLDAYEKLEGDMQAILDSIMLCTDDDEERFAAMIEEEIKAKKSFPRFARWREYMKSHAASKSKKSNESSAQKAKRAAKKEKEAQEAEALMAAILGKQSSALTAKRGRDFGSLISNLEAKYADPPKAKRGKKPRRQDEGYEEPSEEAFLAAQKRLMEGKGKRR